VLKEFMHQGETQIQIKNIFWERVFGHIMNTVNPQNLEGGPSTRDHLTEIGMVGDINFLYVAHKLGEKLFKMGGKHGGHF
jgi:hypothetical protein